MTKSESREISRMNEEAFQAAQSSWKANNDKASYDTMWHCVYFCCVNMCKSKGKGIVIPNLEEKAMDATIKVMGKICMGETVGKLSSYCYFPVIEQLYNKQLQFVERQISYEAWQEYALANEENN